MWKNRALGGLALTVGACLGLGAAAIFFQGFRTSLVLGGSVALVLVLPSYFSLAWALHKTDKMFYSVFAAGILYRLTGLAFTAWMVWRLARPRTAAVLLSAVGLVILLTPLELYFFQKEGRKSP